MHTALSSLVKPRHLKPGDRVATVAPSWGGAGKFQWRYEAGKRQLQEHFGVTVVEMSHTLEAPEWVAAHPQARAQDLMDAFSDPTIHGIVATIGGDDSIRLIPYLNLDVIRKNPKVFMGFSDTTSLHLACYAAGVTSFYGPSILAGFAENGGMHQYTIDGVRKALFQTKPVGLISRNEEGWTAERLEWGDPSLQTRRRKLLPSTAPKVLQGSGVAKGHLIGGCAEVLEMAKGTAWWPSRSAWGGAILFYETSEDAPSPHFITFWFRNFAAQGILASLKGIVLARPDPQGDETYQERFETAVTDVLAEEGLRDLPVLSGLDFGHTQPMLTLPYGIQASIDCAGATLTLDEAGVGSSRTR
jgi:muramoyltetrapeptide carboxypeptidase LdcA involved in peptidoglycan recycling